MIIIDFILEVYTRVFKSMRNLSVICQAHVDLRQCFSALLNMLDPSQEPCRDVHSPNTFTEDALYMWVYGSSLDPEYSQDLIVVALA